MLGYTHAATGAVGWLVAGPISMYAVTGQTLNAAEMAAGTIACAGAALLPDLDHPQATVSQTFGPVSKLAAEFTAFVSGGHRHATHSIFFAVLMGAATWAGIRYGPEQFPYIILFILTAFALRGLGLVPPGGAGWKSFGAVAESFLVVWLINEFGVFDSWYWLAVAVTLGCLIHVSGDCCTPERCPVLWPKKTRYGVGLIEHTGNWVEVKIVAPVFVGAALLLAWVRIAPLIGWNVIPWAS